MRPIKIIGYALAAVCLAAGLATAAAQEANDRVAEETAPGRDCASHLATTLTDPIAEAIDGVRPDLRPVLGPGMREFDGQCAQDEIDRHVDRAVALAETATEKLERLCDQAGQAVPGPTGPCMSLLV